MLRDPESRPVKVANCSGYHGDPAYEMYRQATLGEVDFITGDYLAEVNLAKNAQARRARKHPGYEETAWQRLQRIIDVIAEKGIRIVINGGALDPKALAIEVAALILDEKRLDLRVAYVSGGDLYPQVGPNMPTTKEELQHLGSGNPSVVPSELTYAFMNAPDGRPTPMISAHAYLGARGIVEGLRRGAQIIICGRVADATLIAGNLTESSAYVTGANFTLINIRLISLSLLGSLLQTLRKMAPVPSPTKHLGTQGLVTLMDDGVRVSGIRGSPPPPTTKLAVFYPGAYEAEILLNATGYATAQKWDLLEKQIRHFLPASVANDLDTLELQRVGAPEPNPSSQLKSTIYMRIFVASRSAPAVAAVSKTMENIAHKHFSGFHATLDMRTATEIPEKINILEDRSKVASFDIPRPCQYVSLEPRETYDPTSPTVYNGPTKDIRLGDIALARSGDKGANLNFGIFVPNPTHWDWLRSFMTTSQMQALTEFPHIHAVHFVIYGILGRGVSSPSRLDGYGKGFADYIRDKIVQVPAQFKL
ncbi:hypothetical protein BDV23DRAFT_168429 [Aspergillus alliaceus]|uniref:Acyclic terpene utilisation N-terminal domain-containing protein n=1 Tax=Petromyces alliaceus TaxID=209559 RepID=A0A5N7CPY6_PETAA|nr:hypothetical protein BDV23DRAFT_168429 [Aspergillus alliaceus]